MNVAPNIDAHEDKIAASSGVAAMFELARYGRGLGWQLFGAIGLVFMSSVIVMVSANILGRLAEGLMTKAPAFMIWRFAAIVMACELAAVVLRYYGRLALSYLTNNVSLNLRRELFGKLNRLPIAYYDTQPLGRTITRLTSDVEGIEMFFNGTLSALLIAFINIGVVFVSMLLTDFQFGSMVVMTAIPAVIFTLVTRAPVRQWLRLSKRRNAFSNSKLAEFLSGMPVIKVFALEDWTFGKYKEAVELHLKAQMKVMGWNAIIRPSCVFLCAVPTAFILWNGGAQVLEGTLSIGLFVAFVRYSERFLQPIMVVTQEIQVVQEAMSSSERVQQMLNEPEEKDVFGPDGSYDGRLRGDVTFRDIWLSYRADNFVLKGVNFQVNKGMTVAFVGPTGSGKTSTLSLMPRLYPFQGGDITIDGRSISHWNRKALRSQIGLVSQDVVIFRGTLRANLLAAVNDPEEASLRLQAACEATGLAHIMRRFPDGFDTILFDGGDNLSQGERQLVSFTRMLLKDPSILLLDEATANIDEECEQLIQSAIARLMRDRTCFVIAHRLSTIIQCDMILVFDNGQIVERGTHSELMAMHGLYYRLASTQKLEMV